MYMYMYIITCTENTLNGLINTLLFVSYEERDSSQNQNQQ